jgi:hypothetical protein
VIKQTIKPNTVILINDGKPFDLIERKRISTYFSNINFLLLKNKYEKGAAGAWNTGIEFLSKNNFCGYVAIIDDDDTWDNNHLELNIECAKSNETDVVISGLRMIKNNIDTNRELTNNLKADDFLKGNPGWQGSNTFVSIEILKKIRGFRNGLQSTNDRDLAFRILSLPNIKVAYTNKWTSSWFHESDNQSLSLPRSISKIEGLQWFWYIYKKFYNLETENIFFERALKCFGIQKHEIINIQNKPKNITLFGDLNV